MLVSVNSSRLKSLMYHAQVRVAVSRRDEVPTLLLTKVLGSCGFPVHVFVHVGTMECTRTVVSLYI
jgi:hypothetical protein